MRFFTQDIPVLEGDIDVQNRVSNIRYIEWMQDAAIAHSSAVGWSMDRYAEVKQSWVVRQHTITYRSPAMLGDTVQVFTWISSIGSCQSLRSFLFCRKSDHAILAEAQTQWVYINSESGRPLRIPQEVLSAFPVVEKAEILDRVKKEPLA